MSYPHQHADPLTSLFAHNVDVFVKVESPIDSSAKEFKTFRLIYNLAFDSYTRFLIAYAFITFISQQLAIIIIVMLRCYHTELFCCVIATT